MYCGGKLYHSETCVKNGLEIYAPDMGLDNGQKSFFVPKCIDRKFVYTILKGLVRTITSAPHFFGSLACSLKFVLKDHKSDRILILYAMPLRSNLYIYIIIIYICVIHGFIVGPATLYSRFCYSKRFMIFLILESTTFSYALPRTMSETKGRTLKDYKMVYSSSLGHVF